MPIQRRRGSQTHRFPTCHRPIYGRHSALNCGESGVGDQQPDCSTTTRGPDRVGIATVRARRGIHRRRQIAEGGMEAVVVVVVFPVADDDAGVGERPEGVDVEAFVADPGVEGLDVAARARPVG
jgi:hypothetical protein